LSVGASRQYHYTGDCNKNLFQSSFRLEFV
jgi:hypothetical protein